MPRYDFSCEECGVFERFCSVDSRDRQVCPTCAGPVKRHISRLTVVGPTHSRPLDYQKQLGMSFDTVAARDKWFADNGCVEHSKSDSEIRKLSDKLSESRTKNARKAGFDSVGRQQEAWKAEQKKARERV